MIDYDDTERQISKSADTERMEWQDQGPDRNAKYRDPDELSVFVRSRCNDPDQKYYVLLDENSLDD